MAKLAISAVVLVASRLLSCYYSILTVGVKTCVGGVGCKLGAFDEKPPAFGGKRGDVGEKAGATSCSLWAYDRALGAKRMAAL